MDRPAGRAISAVLAVLRAVGQRERLPITPEDDLTGRFGNWIGQASQGKLSGQVLPQDAVDLANRIGKAQDEGYAVSHNVMQVQIPRPGNTGSVSANLLPWPPAK